jgi:hypothetical protein
MKERIGKDNYGDNDRQNLRLLRAKNALAKTEARHCEARSAEAIQSPNKNYGLMIASLCFAKLAMTE